MRFQIEVLEGLDAVDAARWDALVPGDDPFVEHRFLRALEQSGSVGPDTGWLPCHLLLRDEGGTMRGAMPLYLKTDSYGEYIFDWGWADAATRAGVPYYPKLVSAVPFTPASGRRLLVDDPEDGALIAGLAAGVRQLVEETEASSAHILFCGGTEVATLAERHHFLPRRTYQYHWDDEDYGDFDGFLAALRSSARKQIRKERRKAAECGLTLQTLRGPELSSAQWDALYGFYRNTVGRKYAIPYLTRAFFEQLQGPLSERVVVALASDGPRPVAASLAFHRGEKLFGRYWGCCERHDFLHFELCYYRLLEFALEQGIKHVEAGAQGQHKIKRGFLPAPTFSAHWLEHAGLRRAVAEYLPHEARQNQREMEFLAEHGPFRR